MRKITDADLYREFSKPFDSNKAVGEAMDGFEAEVKELRKKYKLPNVLVLVSLSYLDNDEEASVMFTSSYGESRHVLPMLAEAYGAARVEHRIAIEKLVLRKEKT